MLECLTTWAGSWHAPLGGYTRADSSGRQWVQTETSNLPEQSSANIVLFWSERGTQSQVDMISFIRWVVCFLLASAGLGWVLDFKIEIFFNSDKRGLALGRLLSDHININIRRQMDQLSQIISHPLPYNFYPPHFSILAQLKLQSNHLN